MSLEIREMILRTTLTGDIPEGGDEKKQEPDVAASGTNTQAIVAECMEKLKEWLREENER